MKDIIVGLFAVIGVILGIAVIVSLILALAYGLGWLVGWFLHLMVGPDIIFGITFEQFIGVLFVAGSIVGGSKTTIEKSKENEKIKELGDQLKNYRGY